MPVAITVPVAVWGVDSAMGAVVGAAALVAVDVGTVVGVSGLLIGVGAVLLGRFQGGIDAAVVDDRKTIVRRRGEEGKNMYAADDACQAPVEKLAEGMQGRGPRICYLVPIGDQQGVTFSQRKRVAGATGSPLTREMPLHHLPEARGDQRAPVCPIKEPELLVYGVGQREAGSTSAES